MKLTFALVLTFAGLAQADPQLTSWFTTNSAKYARIVETDAELAAGTTKTTWTRTSGPNTISQSLPVYAGPQQVDYSTNYIYLRTPSLGTFTMGPWYDNAAKSALFVNICKNQGLIVKLPRTASLGSIPSTKTQTAGYQFGGALQDAIGYLVDGVSIFDPTDGFSYSGGTEQGGPFGQWHRDAYVNEGITFDKSNQHQQNTGKYHSHANPIALRYQLGDAVSYSSTTKTYAETLSPTKHSPIIGWMLDGLPVYGPYGYSSALDSSSGVRRMVGGFVKRNGTTTGVDNIASAGRSSLPAWATRNGGTNASGPNVSTTYPLGRYIEDWAYLGDLIKSGSTKYQQGTDFDLNEYNVRYCVTPEFPGGTWAYFLSIDASGTPAFPYMINRWFYGTPAGGTVTSISESVTNQFKGGASTPLTIPTTPTLTGSNVSLTWNSVEGGTYAVDASTDNATWTSKATNVVAADSSTSRSYTAVASSGTEYGRVQRTALASYDTTGTATATVSQSATASLVHPATLSISTASALTGSVVGVSYTQTFIATDGTTPYAWSLSAGALPGGLTLNATSGVLDGTPTTAGTFSFALQVQDNASLAVTKAFTLVIEASAPSITSTSPLLYGVKGSAYAQTISSTGGTAPYAWSVSSGSLPTGLSLNSSTGAISGTPTASGIATFAIKLTDAANVSVTQSFSLTIVSSALAPVMNSVTLGSTTVGESYSATVSATNYPKTFTITGLPSGLSYVSSTGVISGRAKASGVFNVQIKATNTGGTSETLTAPLTVKAIANTSVGSFVGVVARDATANGGLGGLLKLSTTSLGTFTAKITSGATTKSATGYLNASAPQISITLGSATLQLTLGSNHLLTGTHGSAAVDGWRQTFNSAANPPTSRLGYYSVGLALADAADDGLQGIPQGNGYATFSIGTAGTLSIAGKTSDGSGIATSTFLGPNGEMAFYTSLYANLGSIAGKLTLSEDSSDASNNTATGSLTWLKPTNTARAYAAGFGPINLSAYGEYLASSSKGQVVLGLPAAGSAAIRFSDGGLSAAALDPDLAAFTYSSTNTITLPATNPAKVTITLNKNTGALSGSFTLVDGTLTRKVSYYGMTVRPASGTAKAAGYFLLPQIPTGSETSSTSPMLSGGVTITP